MSDNEFGYRLKQLRELEGQKAGGYKITQREVAAAMNITPGAYGSWESGRTRPGIDMLPRIASYFGISIDSLLGYTPGIKADSQHIAAETGLVWSLRRAAQTEDEEKGIEIWRRLAKGEDFDTIADAFGNLSAQALIIILLI